MDATSTKCENKVTNDYCTTEPCTKYSSCQTCLADAFCGWCNGECVEGEKAGPLTGSCPAWEYGRCSKDNTPDKATVVKRWGGDSAKHLTGADNDPTSTRPASEPEEAISDIEGVADKLKSQNRDIIQSAGKLEKTHEHGVGIVSHLKHILKEWKLMTSKTESSWAKARASYKAQLEGILAKRRHSLDIIRLVMKQEFADELREAEVVKKMMAAEERAEVERMNTDRGAAFNATIEAKKASDVNVAVPELTRTDIAMHHVEKFLSGISKKDSVLMSNMHKIAENSVEQELHKAAQRKMAREEAAWYSCAWLLEEEGHQCADFHENYNGAQRGRDLTPEEHTRVCNEVNTRMKALSAPKMPSKEVIGSRDKSLAWCVSNVNILCAKCK